MGTSLGAKMKVVSSSKNKVRKKKNPVLRTKIGFEFRDFFNQLRERKTFKGIWIFFEIRYCHFL